MLESYWPWLGYRCPASKRRKTIPNWWVPAALRLIFVVAVFVGAVTILNLILEVPSAKFPLFPTGVKDTAQDNQYLLPASFVRLETLPSSNHSSPGSGEIGARVKLVLSVNLSDLSDLVEAYRRGFAPAKERFPDDGGIVLRNENLCRGTKRPISWVVVVHSAPSHHARRQMLRDTWANVNLFRDVEFRVAFLIGQPATRSVALESSLREEFSKYGDLVQGNFTDSYKNMTLKAVMGLRWLTQFCNEAPFAIKADDDTFLNIFEIVPLLAANSKKQHVIICPLWPENSMPILRDPKTCMKWCVRRQELRGKTHFPKYCAGIGYVMSRDLVPQLYNASKTTPFFWIDDVYVTGLLVQKLTSKPTYIDLLNRFSLRDTLAIEEYTNHSRTLSYWYVHAKDETNFLTLWKSLMTRLTENQRNMVNTDLLSQWAKQ